MKRRNKNRPVKTAEKQESRRKMTPERIREEEAKAEIRYSPDMLLGMSARVRWTEPDAERERLGEKVAKIVEKAGLRDEFAKDLPFKIRKERYDMGHYMWRERFGFLHSADPKRLEKFIETHERLEWEGKQEEADNLVKVFALGLVPEYEYACYMDIVYDEEKDEFVYAEREGHGDEKRLSAYEEAMRTLDDKSSRVFGEAATLLVSAIAGYLDPNPTGYEPPLMATLDHISQAIGSAVYREKERDRSKEILADEDVPF